MTRCMTCGIRRDIDGVCHCPETATARIAALEAEVERLTRERDAARAEADALRAQVARVEATVDRLEGDPWTEPEAQEVLVAIRAALKGES